MKKGDFVGRDAVEAQAGQEAEWDWVGLEITEDSPEPMGSDPILKDGKWIGYVTSCSHGYRTGKHCVLGYVKRRSVEMGAPCNVRVLGTLRAARRQSPHVYDPDNLRLKS